MRIFEIAAKGNEFVKSVKKIKEMGGQYDGLVKVWGVKATTQGVTNHLDAASLYGWREISVEDYKARRAAALAAQGK